MDSSSSTSSDVRISLLINIAVVIGVLLFVVFGSRFANYILKRRKRNELAKIEEWRRKLVFQYTKTRAVVWVVCRFTFKNEDQMRCLESFYFAIEYGLLWNLFISYFRGEWAITKSRYKSSSHLVDVF